jgi:hypothetical protein
LVVNSFHTVFLIRLNYWKENLRQILFVIGLAPAPKMHWRFFDVRALGGLVRVVEIIPFGELLITNATSALESEPNSILSLWRKKSINNFVLNSLD